MIMVSNKHDHLNFFHPSVRSTAILYAVMHQEFSNMLTLCALYCDTFVPFYYSCLQSRFEEASTFST